jgi:phosphoribosyl 1,2-cyclic phosphate phosphodiesterase
MKVSFLGTGTSQGVPVIACTCRVCSSDDLRDKRLRCSVYIEWDTNCLVIDTGPDFRQQMLREKIQRVDAVLYTHEHKDHLAGLDDIRAFNFILGKHMDIYAGKYVEEAIRREFAYIFAQDK